MADQQKSWYIEIGGKKVGPLAESDVINLHKVGKVSDTARLIRDDMDNWVSLPETGIINNKIPSLPKDDIIPTLPDNEDASSSQAQKAINSVSASHFLTSGTLYLYEDKIEFVCNSTTSIPFCDVADVYLDKELIILKLTNGKDYFFDVIPESFLQEWVESIRTQWQIFNVRIEVGEATPPLNDDVQPLPEEEIDYYQSSDIVVEVQMDTQDSLIENTPLTENKIDSAVKKAYDVVESIRHEVTTSETIDNLKTSAGSGIDSAAKKVSELVDILPDNIGSSKVAVKIKSKLQGKKSRTYFLIGAFGLIVAILLLLYVPVLRWIILIGALGWLGLCVYKKPIPIGKYEIKVNTNKIVPIIASVIAIALILALPSGSGAGSIGSSVRNTGSGTASQSSNTAGSQTGSTSSFDFSNAADVTAYFEQLFPNARNMGRPFETVRLYGGDRLNGFAINVTNPGEVTVTYFVTHDGRLFDSSDTQNIRPID